MSRQAAGARVAFGFACALAHGCKDGPVVVADIHLQNAGASGASSAGSSGSGMDGGTAGAGGDGGTGGTGGAAGARSCVLPSWYFPLAQIVTSENKCTIELTREDLIAGLEELERQNPLPAPSGETRGPEACDFTFRWGYLAELDGGTDVIVLCPSYCSGLEKLLRDTSAAHDACLHAQGQAP